jgi:hypothetical protein
MGGRKGGASGAESRAGSRAARSCRRGRCCSRRTRASSSRRRRTRKTGTPSSTSSSKTALRGSPERPVPGSDVPAAGLVLVQTFAWGSRVESGCLAVDASPVRDAVGYYCIVRAGTAGVGRASVCTSDWSACLSYGCDTCVGNEIPLSLSALQATGSTVCAETSVKVASTDARTPSLTDARTPSLTSQHRAALAKLEPVHVCVPNLSRCRSGHDQPQRTTAGRYLAPLRLESSLTFPAARSQCYLCPQPAPRGSRPQDQAPAAKLLVCRRPGIPEQAPRPSDAKHARRGAWTSRRGVRGRSPRPDGRSTVASGSHGPCHLPWVLCSAESQCQRTANTAPSRFKNEPTPTARDLGLPLRAAGSRLPFFWGEAVLMMELPRRHSTPPGGGRFRASPGHTVRQIADTITQTANLRDC